MMRQHDSNKIMVTVSLDFIKSLEEKIASIESKLNMLSSTEIIQADQLLTRFDAMKLLGVGKDAFRGYMNSGKLKVHKVGRRIFVRRSEIENMINNHTL